MRIMRIGPRVGGESICNARRFGYRGCGQGCGDGRRCEPSGVNLAIDNASAGVIGPKQPDIVLSDGVIEPVSVAYDGHRLFVGDVSQRRVLIWNALPSVDNQLADVVLGQSENGTGAATVGTPTALASDGTNLFVADTENRRILVFSAGDIDLSENEILNSASCCPGR